MAQLVLGLAGAAVGSLFGAPQIGWAIGATLGSAFGPTQKSSGPRLTDLKVTASEYGAPIPYIIGNPRVSGTVIWASTKREIATTTSQGKGAGGAEYTSYTYEIDLLYLLSDNEILGVRRIWSNGKLIWTRAEESDAESIEAGEDTVSWKAMRIYTGAADQLPDPVYEAAVGSGNAPAYRGRGTVMLEGVNLGSSGQLPNLTFEIGLGGDNVQYFFNMPYEDTHGPEDIEANPLSYVESNPENSIFSVSGFTSSFPEEGDKRAYLTYSGPKIGEMLRVDSPVFIEVEAYMNRTPGSGNTDYQRFIGVSGSQYAMGWIRRDGGLYLRLAVGSDIREFPAYDGKFRMVFDNTESKMSFFRLDGEEWIAMWEDVYFSSPSGDVTIVVGNIDTPSVNNYIGSTIASVVGYQDSQYVGTPLTPEPLDEVVGRLVERCGMTASDYDATDLEGQLVRAMAIQPTAARAVLDQLAAAHYFECVESEKLYMRRRGAAPAATIPYGDIGADALMTIQESNDLEIPAQVNVTYLNLSNAYQQGNEMSDRLTTESTAVGTVQLAMGLTPASAKAIADTAVLDQAIASRTITAALDMRYAALEPTDVLIVTDSAGQQYRVRIVKIADASGVRQLDLVADDARVLRQIGITGEDYDDDYTVTKFAKTDLAMLDIPILRDQDDNPGVYAAGDGKKGAWPGYALYLDDKQLGTSNSGAAMGVCSEALGTWTSLLVDESSLITVTLNPGDQLESITHADLSTTISNYAAVGAHGRWEIVQFTRAELVSAGVYRLSGFARGRLGTEHLRGTHLAGDKFVLLDGNGLLRDIADLAARGTEREYSGVTLGGRVKDATKVEIAPVWEGLKPWAPANLHKTWDNGQITVSWGRRSRYVSSALSGVVPLAEAVEAYEIDVETPSGSITTFQASSSPVTLQAKAFSRTLTAPDGGGTAIHGVVMGGYYYSIYDVSGNGGIQKRDASTLEFVAQKIIGLSTGNAGSLISSGGYLYTCSVGSGTQGVVKKWDGDLNEIASATLDRPGDGQNLTVVGGLLWVACPYTGVTRGLDLGSLATVRDAAVASHHLANDGVALWAVSRSTDRAYRIDPATGTVTLQFGVGRFPIGCAIAGGLLWSLSAYEKELSCYSTGDGTPQSFRLSTVDDESTSHFGALTSAGNMLAVGTSLVQIVDASRLAKVGQIKQPGAFVMPPGSTMLTEEMLAVSNENDGVSYYEIADLPVDSIVRVYQMSATVGRGNPASI
jgi:hypothetical protein